MDASCDIRDASSSLTHNYSIFTITLKGKNIILTSLLTEFRLTEIKPPQYSKSQWQLEERPWHKSRLLSIQRHGVVLSQVLFNYNTMLRNVGVFLTLKNHIGAGGMCLHSQHSGCLKRRVGSWGPPGYIMKFCPQNQNKTKNHAVSYTVKTTQQVLPSGGNLISLINSNGLCASCRLFLCKQHSYRARQCCKQFVL